MTTFRFNVSNGGYSSWFLLPTIRLGSWSGMDGAPAKRGGWLAFTFLKFDACFMWTTVVK